MNLTTVSWEFGYLLNVTICINLINSVGFKIKSVNQDLARAEVNGDMGERMAEDCNAWT